MNQRDELQKLLDLLDQKIAHFRRTKVTAVDPGTIFSLDRQIEDVEAERSKVSEEIQALDAVAASQQLYRALLQLGYKEQVLSFLNFIQSKEEQSIGAFLIQGEPSYGQRWLLNRLVKRHIPYGSMAKKVPVELDRRARRKDVSALWRELGYRCGLKKNTPPETTEPDERWWQTQIAKQVSQWWQTQNVLLIFHDVDEMPQEFLAQLIRELWLPLVSEARTIKGRTHKNKLMMFLIDYKGCVDIQTTQFVEQPESTWEPTVTIKLPTITPFSNPVLQDWITTIRMEPDTLPVFKVINQIGDPVQAILDRSENGIPEQAMSEICSLYDCIWDDAIETWLTL